MCWLIVQMQVECDQPRRSIPPHRTLLDSTILFIGPGDRSQWRSVATSPFFVLGGWSIHGSQPAFWVLSWPHHHHPIQMSGWGVMGRTCSSSGSTCPVRGGWRLFHSWRLSSPVLMQRCHPKSWIGFHFCRACRSHLNIVMTEPSAPRLHGQLWKSMVLEGWDYKGCSFDCLSANVLCVYQQECKLWCPISSIKGVIWLPTEEKKDWLKSW